MLASDFRRPYVDLWHVRRFQSRECLGAVVSTGPILDTSQASSLIVSQTYGEQ